MTGLRGLALAALVVWAVGTAHAQSGDTAARGWWNAPRHSSGLAPDPEAWAGQAIVQVYAARTYGWRGRWAVHPWIIYKRSGETRYTRWDVVGWRAPHVVQRDYAEPDGLWYGAVPQVLVDRRGPEAEALIDAVERAVASYPHANEYRSYPGPNSNTFLAHIGREVPALGLDLPATAIGKDYRPLTSPVGRSPTGSGVQFSVWGLLGVSVGWEEGLEWNVLGLHFGIDLNPPALRLPSLGRLGAPDAAVDVTPAGAGDSPAQTTSKRMPMPPA